MADKNHRQLLENILLQGAQSLGQRNCRGSVEQANCWTDAQTLMGTLSEGQSWILCFNFLSAGCSYSVLWLLSSFTLSCFFYLLFQCSPVRLSWHSPFASSRLVLFSFLMLFLRHVPLSCLLFFLSPFILHIQTYLCNKRLPHMSHIFQKQNLDLRKISLRSKVTCLPQKPTNKQKLNIFICINFPTIISSS